MSENALRTDADFEKLYERNWLYVYRLCYTYLKNEADAEDCAEDVFVKVLTAEISFQDETHERKWFTVAAANQCKDRLKSTAYRMTDSLNAEDAPEIAAPERTDYSDVTEAVLKLPEQLREVIILYYYDGYRSEEIADMLGRPPSTVRNQLRDARKRLQFVLGGEEYE